MVQKVVDLAIRAHVTLIDLDWNLDPPALVAEANQGIRSRALEIRQVFAPQDRRIGGSREWR